jgi:hypothetical protein
MPMGKLVLTPASSEHIFIKVDQVRERERMQPPRIVPCHGARAIEMALRTNVGEENKMNQNPNQKPGQQQQGGQQQGGQQQGGGQQKPGQQQQQQPPRPGQGGQQGQQNR